MSQSWLDQVLSVHTRLSTDTVDARTIRSEIETAPAGSPLQDAVQSATSKLRREASQAADSLQRIDRLVDCLLAALRIPLLGAVPCAMVLPEGAIACFAALTHGSGIRDETVHACLTVFWEAFSAHADAWLRTLTQSGQPPQDQCRTLASTVQLSADAPAADVRILLHLLLVVCAGSASAASAAVICRAVGDATAHHSVLDWAGSLATLRAPAVSGAAPRLQQQLAELLSGSASAALAAPALRLACRWAGARDVLLRQAAHCVLDKVSDAMLAAAPAPQLPQTVATAARGIAADAEPGAALPHVNVLLVAAARSMGRSQLPALLDTVCEGLAVGAGDTPCQVHVTTAPAMGKRTNSGGKHAQLLLGLLNVAALQEGIMPQVTERVLQRCCFQVLSTCPL
jgi:hypothetical protein